MMVLLAGAVPAWSQSYPGSLGNTATATPASGVTDPDTGNNSGTDTNTLAAVAALSVQKSVTGASPVTAGGTVSYRIDVANAGPSAALGATIADIVPAQLTGASWTCTASAGSSCGVASGSGNVALNANIAAGGSLVVQITAVAPSLTPATIGANTATITPPAGTSDPTPGDNSATTPGIPVVPRALVAFDDTAGPIDGTPGQADVVNVLSNDTLAGVAVTPAQVVLTAPPALPLIIQPNGAVDVAAGTPTGTYTASYQICESADPANCATAQVTVSVNASATVDALDDVLPPRASGAASPGFNVLANDSLNGAPAVGTVTLTAANTGPLQIAADGSATLAPGTPAGVYSAGYQICETAQPTNCDTASASVRVLPALLANDDSAGPVNGSTGAVAVINVLDNDDAGGGSPPAPGVVTFTGGSTAQVVFAADGSVTVPPATAAGVHSASYTLCYADAPTVCDSATVQVTVVAPGALAANDDAYGGVNGATGAANIGNVLGNDTLNGGGITAGQVILTPTNAGPVTIGTDGTVAVAAGTPAGSYTPAYRICETAMPDNCATATVTVAVATLAASADTLGPALPGTVGGNVLANDFVDGAPATAGTTVVTQTAGTPGFVIAVDGSVSIAAGTAAGTLTGSYQACQIAQPTICDTATVSITVAAGTLIAADDALGPVNGVSGGTATGNVLANDTLNGAAVAGGDVVLVPANAGPISIATDGSVAVAATTPAGTYVAGYQVCEALNPANCDAAQVTVEVTTLTAADDNLGPVNGDTGGVAGNVLANDRLDGAPPSSTEVVLSAANTGPLTIGADGNVHVAAGTPAGTYTATYQICQTASPTVCNGASVSVIVIVNAALNAVDDTFGPIDGAAGSTNVGNVLSNDTMDGMAVAAGSVTLINQSAAPIALAADGTLSIPAGTPAGIYGGSYQICETANPANCDVATLTVNVRVAATLAANDDGPLLVDGTAGSANAGNALTNDTFNGAAVAPGSVIVLSAATAPVTIAADGTIGIAANAVPGTYLAGYQICETAAPDNCDAAVVNVRVATMGAIDDTLGPSAPGGPAGNVLANDVVDGSPATATTVTVTQTGGAPGFVIAPDGSISIAPGTPAGTLTGGYQACQVAQPTICDTATVSITVGAGALAANDDALGPVDGAAGGTASGNVLANDTLNGAAVTAGQVVLTPANAGPVTIAADGSVSVAAGTAAGSYVAGYQLCEVLNPANCDSAQVVIAVTTLVADDDALGPVNGGLGGVAGNVLTNDRLDGAPFAAGTVTLTPTSSGPLSIGADGTVTVAAGTPAGTYTASYQICQVSLPSSCDGAGISVSVTVTAALNAVDDAFGPVDGAAGNANLGNVLGNDTLDGVAVVPGSVTLTSTAGAPLVIAADGTVSVPAGTAAGVYGGSYQLCETANPGNCDSATLTVVVASMLASDDTLGPSAPGGLAGNVLANDVVDGSPATATTVTVTQTGGAPGFVIAPDGSISIAPGTPAGTLTGGYQACQVAQPTICDTATVSITVGAGALAANDDALGPVDGAAGGTASGNVLANDTLNGAAVTAGQVVLTPANAGPVTIAADGSVSVAAGTAAGSYVAGYQLCEVLNPANCDSAQVVIAVTTLVADDDALGPVNGGLGGVAGNVLTNDRLDGAPFAAGAVTLTPTSSGPLSIGTDGTVTVAAGTPAGTYTASYQICQVSLPSSCDGAGISVSVTVTAALNAVDDAFGPVDGAAGNANLGNVLGNDTVNGAPINAAAFTLASTAAAPLSISPAGVVSIAPNASAGTYSATYTLCDAGDPGNCDTATVAVQVVRVDAQDDTFSLASGMAGALVGNVLGNDTLNGGAPNVVTAFWGGVFDSHLALEPNGDLRVLAGTPAGTYTGNYTVCARAAPSICDTASVTVAVASGPSPLAAANDTGSADGRSGGVAIASVLANDTLAGAPPTTAQVSLSVVTPSASAGVVLDLGSGAVNVAPGTAANNYSLRYRACEQAEPANCVEALAIVAITAAAIDAMDDTAGPVDGITGAPSVVNVLDNDTLAGLAPSAGQVTLSVVNASPVLIVHADGRVDVVAGTMAGTYSATYRICEALNPANCDQATVTVTVAAAAIDAVDDTASAPVGTASGGQAIANVAANDTLAGAAVQPGQIVLSQVSSTHANVQLDPASGAVNVAPNTPGGTYTLVYRLCERLNSGNCDDANATVTVALPSLDAVDDAPAPLPGGVGVPDVVNVLANDLYDGAPVVPERIVLAPVTAGPLSLQADGTVDVAAGTPGGTYTLVYSLCDALTPGHCDTATVTVVVLATTLAVADDTAQTPQGESLSLAVLANDTFAGTAPDPARVVVAVSQPPANGTVVVQPDGSLLYTPAQYFSGQDGFQYTVCELAAPDNCATATVTVTVLPNTVTATDDQMRTRTRITVIPVLANDTVSHAPLDPASLSVVRPPAHGEATCAEGTCTYVAADGFAGQDRFGYRVCDVSVPNAVCAEADVVIDVEAAPAVLRVAKTAAQRTARIGDIVRYTIVIDNVGDVDAMQVTLIDSLPPGFAVVAGSIQVGDADATGAPAIARPFRIDALDIPIGERATVTYALRVGAGVGPGVHTNRAVMRDADGATISNEATADVQVMGDPLLEDSLIIGTVFHDVDGDGLQDPGERGLAGVRVVSVEGLITETDPYGRFHITGIGGGRWARGRNFLLKVDVATLPPGSRFTTENPRVLRITPGVPARFDFGVQAPLPPPQEAPAAACPDSPCGEP
ncbi:Ig-like domain-containing protein [Pseudoxanthomonas sp. CF385]|uniref:Ig-like domain-containing protein n=1 Tax=Pseudoxanthomonas sp. CF385 TaxID=1881042 RepID=UPI001587706B|nr:Ig-like domain-containing protein [Pseudoxanthomonas sp. CF385]